MKIHMEMEVFQFPCWRKAARAWGMGWRSEASVQAPARSMNPPLVQTPQGGSGDKSHLRAV